jgi:GNAT superfamily N-acetyltransferase
MLSNLSQLTPVEFILPNGMVISLRPLGSADRDKLAHEDGWDGAGVARYVRLSGDPGAADTAFTVLDEYQGIGIGQVLFRGLAIAGRVNDLRRFHFDVLADNRPMLRVLEKSGVPMDPVSAGLTHGVLDVDSFVAGLDSWPPARALAELARAARPDLESS